MKHFEYLNVPNSEPLTASRSFDGTTNFSYLLSVAKRCKYFLVAGLIAGVIGGSLYVATVKPKYTATVYIYIDSSGKKGADSGGDSSADTADVDSQVEVIRSSQVAAKMANALTPDFREQLGREFISTRSQPALVPAPTAGRDPPESALDLGRILQALAVSRVERTYVLAINFTARSPALAAAVANGFVDAYQGVLAGRYHAGEQARAKWIDQRIQDVRKALLQSEKELQEFRLSPVVGESDAARQELELKTESYHRLYQSLLQQQQEPSASSQGEAFHVITPADASAVKRSPRLTLVVALSLVAGLGAGAAAAALREMSDRSFRTRGQVEKLLGVRFLGWFPRVGKRRRWNPFRGKKASVDRRSASASARVLRVSTDEPRSSHAETLREIRVGLGFLPPKNEPKVIGIVSALPGEGKSVLALNLGRLLAEEGARALVVDGDLRKRGLSRVLAPSVERGLFELLGDGRGRPPLEEGLVPDDVRGMFFLPIAAAKEDADRPGAKFAQKFGALLTEAKNQFDVIVLDLPPLAAVADARALSAAADCFVLVAEWGRTNRGAVAKFLESEGEIRERLLGVVLNKVDLGRLKQYEQSDEPQYYPYREYFSDTGSSKRLP